jgi:hypothetical protein
MLCSRLREKIMFVQQVHSKATIFAAGRAASQSAVAGARAVTARWPQSEGASCSPR